jgi:hypothetical protein
MRYRASEDGNVRAAMLWIDDEHGDPPAQEVADNVWVGLSPDGRVAWIELLETDRVITRPRRTPRNSGTLCRCQRIA